MENSRAVERGHLEIVKLLCNQKYILLDKMDKFQRTSIDIAIKNKNKLIIDCLRKKINHEDMIGNSENNFDFLNDIQFNFENFYPIGQETSVVEKHPSTIVTSLTEKNKQKDNSKEKKLKITNWDFLSDDEEDEDLEFVSKKNDHSDDELNSCKKTRLSFSPIHSVDDTLYWIKSHQSNTSSDLFENRELRLTGIKQKFISFQI